MPHLTPQQIYLIGAVLMSIADIGLLCVGFMMGRASTE